MEINLHKKTCLSSLKSKCIRESTLYLWIKHENIHFFEKKNVNIKIWERILQILKNNHFACFYKCQLEKALSEM